MARPRWQRLPGLAHRSILHPLFVASIFLGAFLLFLVQPFAARTLLPHFGGSPAVWNVSLVFFQAVLLLGYLYAHGLARSVPAGLQMPVHLTVMVLPLLLLPPVLPAAYAASASDRPGFAVLSSLTLLVGAPFFVLSSNSSLVQHWWSRADLAEARDPYWLYAASNLGSLLGLLAYPFLLEPTLGLSAQARVWTAGYGLFLLVMGGAVALAYRRTLRSDRPWSDPSLETADEARPVTPLRRLLWVVRAAVGTSLLLSVTMRITTDVAPVPLFWVVPLAVYLVTFILAFGARDRLSRTWVEAGAAVSLAMAVGLLPFSASFSFDFNVVVNMAALFFGALLCHRDLAADRPDVEHLTAFYLWISLGGVVGGILNSLVAPVVFDSVVEYPLTLLAATLLLYARPRAEDGSGPFKPSWGLAACLAAALALPMALWISANVFSTAHLAIVLSIILMALAYGRYIGFVALSFFVVVVVYMTFAAGSSDVLAQERGFFGVIRVTASDQYVTMVHGTTTHGVQSRDPERRGTPMGYYHAEGPLGAAILSQREGARIGVVGLGTGALAGYLRPGQEMIFHEIDPLVEDLAREHFTYIADSPGTVDLISGDGRLTLEQVPDGGYDLLLVDAFSSDFVPTHLLTVEALDLYRRKVRSGGLVLLHISNRHARLPRVMAGYERATGQPVALQDWRPAETLRDAAAVLVAAIAPDPATISDLWRASGWGPIDEDERAVVWTDAHINLPAVLW